MNRQQQADIAARFEYCDPAAMKPEWRGGHAVSHKFLREEILANKTKPPKHFACARCGKDVMGNG